MKPNLVIVQPPHIHMDAAIERFCESFCDSHYVYLIRPDSVFREDSPAGVRFLNHSLDHPPGFGKVDAIIAVADPQVADRLRACYPESRLAVWHPGENDAVPDLKLSLLGPVMVRDGYGGADESELARAM